MSWSYFCSNVFIIEQDRPKSASNNTQQPKITKSVLILIASQVKEFAGPEKLVLAGSGCESTLHTIEMTQQMAQVGADAAVIITPHCESELFP